MLVINGSNITDGKIVLSRCRENIPFVLGKEVHSCRLRVPTAANALPAGIGAISCASSYSLSKILEPNLIHAVFQKKPFDPSNFSCLHLTDLKTPREFTNNLEQPVPGEVFDGVEYFNSKVLREGLLFPPNDERNFIPKKNRGWKSRYLACRINFGKRKSPGSDPPDPSLSRQNRPCLPDALIEEDSLLRKSRMAEVRNIMFDMAKIDPESSLQNFHRVYGDFLFSPRTTGDLGSEGEEEENGGGDDLFESPMSLHLRHEIEIGLQHNMYQEMSNTAYEVRKEILGSEVKSIPRSVSTRRLIIDRLAMFFSHRRFKRYVIVSDEKQDSLIHLLRSCLRLGIRVNVNWKGLSPTKIRFLANGVIFTSSIHFAQKPLERFSPHFKRDGAPIFFPLEKNTPMNHGTVFSSGPPLDFFSPHRASSGDEALIRRYHESLRGKPYNFTDELSRYTSSQATLLVQAMMTLTYLFQEIEDDLITSKHDGEGVDPSPVISGERYLAGKTPLVIDSEDCYITNAHPFCPTMTTISSISENLFLRSMGENLRLQVSENQYPESLLWSTSKTELILMTYLKRTSVPDLVYHLSPGRQKVFVVQGVRLPVDGWSEQTRTIYQFQGTRMEEEKKMYFLIFFCSAGCYYHRCHCLKNRDVSTNPSHRDDNSIRDATKQCLRLLALVPGVKLHVIYEHDLPKMKADDPGLADFFSQYSEKKFIGAPSRVAFKSGLNTVHAHYVSLPKIKRAALERDPQCDSSSLKIISIDVNGQYGSFLSKEAKMSLPSGPEVILLGSEEILQPCSEECPPECNLHCGVERWAEVPGLITAEFLAPRSLLFPILGFRVHSPHNEGDSQMFYALCHACCKRAVSSKKLSTDQACHHDVNQRTLPVGTWTLSEAHMALERGYTLVAVHCIRFHPEFKVGALHRLYQTLGRKKMIYSGYPPGIESEQEKRDYCRELRSVSGISLEPEEIVDCPIFKNFVKLIMNSLIGRLAMDLARDIKRIVYDGKQFRALIADPEFKLLSFRRISQDALLVTMQPRLSKISAYSRGCLQLSSQISAEGRSQLIRALEKLHANGW